MIELKDKGPKVSYEDIDVIEQKIGFTLPHDYRNFLLTDNGGVPEHPLTIKVVGDIQLGRYIQGELSANVLSGNACTPEGFVWHHVEDGFTLQLVPFDIHLITGRKIEISRFQEHQPDFASFVGDRHGVVPDAANKPRIEMPKVSIQVFFRINGPLDMSNLGWCSKSLGSRMAHDLLPIASDGSGNLICMALAGSDRGSIYLWDWYSEEAPPGYGNLVFISKSFSDFIEGLKTEPA